jgi:hypothetical protein
MYQSNIKLLSPQTILKDFAQVSKGNEHIFNIDIILLIQVFGNNFTRCTRNSKYYGE